MSAAPFNKLVMSMRCSMKIVTALFVVLGAVLFGPAVADGGGEHVTPTAPAEFIEMTNPYDVDDVDEDFLKSAKKIYKRKCKKCHGTDGDGKGSSADDMEIPPTAFNDSGYLAIADSFTALTVDRSFASHAEDLPPR